MEKESGYEVSLGIVKPSAYEKRIGILSMVDNIGPVDLISIRDPYHIPDEKAEEHYGIHKEKPFYQELVDELTSGPSLLFLVAGINIVQTLRTGCGSTDPLQSEVGTIRFRYGRDILHNAVHCSDSSENARGSIKLHLTPEEIATLPQEAQDFIYEK